MRFPVLVKVREDKNISQATTEEDLVEQYTI
jgi:hypothetical protein